MDFIEVLLLNYRFLANPIRRVEAIKLSFIKNLVWIISRSMSKNESTQNKSKNWKELFLRNTTFQAGIRRLLNATIQPNSGYWEVWW